MLLTLILTFFSFLFLQTYMSLKTINIEGNIANQNLRSVSNLTGKNLLFLSTKSLTEDINRNNPNLLVEEVKKIYPDKLSIKLRSLKTLAQLQLNQGYVHLAKEGKIISKTKDLNNRLPLINFYQKFDYYQTSVGNNLDYKEVLTTLFLLDKSSELGLEVKSIDISGLSMIVFNLNNSTTDASERKIFFSAEKEAEKQAYELETILTQFKVKFQDFNTLDLRFDKPVVKF